MAFPLRKTGLTTGRDRNQNFPWPQKAGECISATKAHPVFLPTADMLFPPSLVQWQGSRGTMLGICISCHCKGMLCLTLPPEAENWKEVPFSPCHFIVKKVLM